MNNSRERGNFDNFQPLNYPSDAQIQRPQKPTLYETRTDNTVNFQSDTSHRAQNHKQIFQNFQSIPYQNEKYGVEQFSQAMAHNQYRFQQNMNSFDQQQQINDKENIRDFSHFNYFQFQVNIENKNISIISQQVKLNPQMIPLKSHEKTKNKIQMIQTNDHINSKSKSHSKKPPSVQKNFSIQVQQQLNNQGYYKIR